jgi:hypothetical protein
MTFRISRITMHSVGVWDMISRYMIWEFTVFGRWYTAFLYFTPQRPLIDNQVLTIRVFNTHFATWYPAYF